MNYVDLLSLAQRHRRHAAPLTVRACASSACALSPTVLRVISPRGGRSRSRGCRHRLELHGPLLRAARCEAESGEPRNPVPEPSRTLEAGTRGRGSGWRRGTASCLQIDGQYGEEVPGGGRRGAPAGTRQEARTLARWGRSRSSRARARETPREGGSRAAREGPSPKVP